MAKKANWIQAIGEQRQWREADARQALDTWERSGQSMSAFMRQHGMSADRLRWWRKRLNGRDAAGNGHVLAQVPQDVALAPLLPVMVTTSGYEVPMVTVMFDDVRVEIAEPAQVAPTWVGELVHSLRRQG